MRGKQKLGTGNVKREFGGETGKLKPET